MPPTKLGRKDFQQTTKLTRIPTVSEWQTMSSAHCQHNPTMIKYLSTAIGDYWKAQTSLLAFGGCHRLDLLFALFNIYSSAGEWIHSSTWNPILSVERRRHMKDLNPAVKAVLYRATDELLARMRLKNVMELEQRLRSLFEVEMVDHGIECDIDAALLKNSGLKWLEADEMRKYRIYFRDTKAYQFNEQGRVELANLTNVEKAGYVFTMSQILYSREEHQSADVGVVGFYHSAYTQGCSILCAGHIGIRNGDIQCIDNNSGHYAPGAGNLRFVLRHFQRKGVNVDRLRVTTYTKNKAMVHPDRATMSGRQYMASF